MNPLQEDETLSEQHMLGLINHYLSLHVYSTATFLCERLYAQNKKPSILNKLAACYYASNHIEKTFMLLRGCTSPDNRYLYAVCAEKLGNLQEAEKSLLYDSTCPSVPLATHIKNLNNTVLNNTSSPNECAAATRQFVQDQMHVPNGASGLFMLGTICRKGNRKQQAHTCFKLCLVLEPHFWGAFAALSEMGFEGHENQFQQANQQSSEAADPSSSSSLSSLSSSSSSSLAVPSASAFATPGFAATTPLSNTAYETPGVNSSSSSSSSSSSATTTNNTTTTTTTNNILSTNEPRTPSNNNNNTTGIPTPRNTVGRPRTHPSDYISDQQANLALFKLLHVLGTGYHLLCQYQCKSALKMFNTLHAKDCNSGWVLNQIAKCYFEIPNYKQAAFIFEKIRTIEPYRTEGMELYSTTLWQLKQEIKLSYLAQQLTQYGKVSPHVWCVVGNCFSFQKEHDLALKFFQRAIQIDDRFTYAYTLSGHEYVSNEDFDKAIECYRHAIRTDDRHYNAWFGLGTIYYRQEKYDIAEYHFRKALNINSKSSVLHNYVGLVQSQRGEVSRPVGLVVCLCVCTDCSSVFFFLFSLLFLSCCYRTKVHWNHLKKQRNWDRAILKRNSLVLEYCVK
tara:strand:+ start:68 stop:1930 length:1863 start_codon:yes stop_codon:yes gene_type:complete